MTTKPSKSELVAYLEEHLSAARMTHVLGVRDIAMEYARAHGVNPESAEVASLLHDAAKWMPIPRLFEECARYGLQLSRVDRLNPVALHGFVAAEMGRELFGVAGDACQAVRGYTTGRPGMTELDMVLYAADFTEPSRPFPEAAIARDLVMADLLDGAIRTMEFRLRALMSKGRMIHPRTVEARNDLLARARS